MAAGEVAEAQKKEKLFCLAFAASFFLAAAFLAVSFASCRDCMNSSTSTCRVAVGEEAEMGVMRWRWVNPLAVCPRLQEWHGCP